MWRKKKFIIGLLAAVLIAGAGLGGVAYAQENKSDSQTDSLMARVAEILGIDQQRVEEAFSQARTELHEERLDRYIQNLIDKGIITEEQAAEYKEWLQSRPDLEEYRDKMQEWYESRPDIQTEETQDYSFFRHRGGMADFDGLDFPCR